MRSVTRGLAATAFVAVVVIGAKCGDPTAAVPAHPLVGTYDVTTVLDSFSFETGTPSPPDCPYQTGYCTHHRAFSGATLFGTLTIAEPTSDSTPFNATGVFSGQFCDTIDYKDLTGCLHVAPIAAAAYTQGQLSLASGFPTDSSFKGTTYTPPANGSSQGRVVWFSGAKAGDSLSGRVYWSLYFGRSPPTHQGRFVARRRR